MTDIVPRSAGTLRQYAFRVLGSYMDGDAGRMRRALVEEYFDDYADTYHDGADGFTAFLGDRLDLIRSKGTETGLTEEWQEGMLQTAASHLPVCDDCLGMMGYYGWMEAGLRTWDGGRPGMEEDKAQIFPDTVTGNAPPEAEKTLAIEYSCPIEEHDDSHVEVFSLSNEELLDFLQGKQVQSEKIEDILDIRSDRD